MPETVSAIYAGGRWVIEKHNRPILHLVQKATPVTNDPLTSLSKPEESRVAVFDDVRLRKYPVHKRECALSRHMCTSSAWPAVVNRKYA